MARPGNKTVFIDATLHLHVEYECLPMHSESRSTLPTGANETALKQYLPLTLGQIVKKLNKRIENLLNGNGLDPFTYTLTLDEDTASLQVTPVFTEADDIREIWVAKELTTSE